MAERLLTATTNLRHDLYPKENDNPPWLLQPGTQCSAETWYLCQFLSMCNMLHYMRVCKMASLLVPNGAPPSGHQRHNGGRFKVAKNGRQLAL